MARTSRPSSSTSSASLRSWAGHSVPATMSVVARAAWCCRTTPGRGSSAPTPKIIGRIVHLNGHAYTVTGVMPAGFRYRVDLRVWALATDGVPPSPIEIDGPLVGESRSPLLRRRRPAAAFGDARGRPRGSDAPSPKRSRARIRRPRKGSTTACARCTISRSATCGLRCSCSWRRSAWCCSSPARTSRACCWRARQRASVRWRCGRRSAPAGSDRPTVPDREPGARRPRRRRSRLPSPRGRSMRCVRSRRRPCPARRASRSTIASPRSPRR